MAKPNKFKIAVGHGNLYEYRVIYANKTLKEVVSTLIESPWALVYTDEHMTEVEAFRTSKVWHVRQLSE